MTDLKDTVALMNSADYKERFQAEYYQVETRFLKLLVITRKWDKGELNFIPTCPREIYGRQLKYMINYIDILVQRSIMENVELDVNEEIKELLSNKIPG